MNKIINNQHEPHTNEADDRFIVKMRKDRPVPPVTFQHRLLNEILQNGAPSVKPGWQPNFKSYHFVIAFCVFLAIFVLYPNPIWAADKFTQLFKELNIKYAANEIDPEITSHGNPVTYQDRDSIQSQVNFRVLQPMDLPDGYSELGFIMADDTVFWEAIKPSIDTEANEVDMLVFIQTRSNPGALNIGSATVEEVIVRQQTGLWIEGATGYSFSIFEDKNSNDQIKSASSSYLIWQENDITCIFHSNRLSLDDMLSIAESIH